ncbi:MAG: FAD-binding protein [Thermodesulfobacteriota bacterium]
MSLAEMETLDCDLLVVGAGCAGCWAAIRAAELGARVILAEKGTVARSGTTLYCHDMLAPAKEEEVEEWLPEIVEHAEYMSDQRFAEILVREQGERVKDMLALGVPFEMDKEGKLFQDVGRGHIKSRVILYDGRKLMEILRSQAIARGVRLVERVAVFHLLTSDGCHPSGGRVIGAIGLNTRTGKVIVFRAKAVMLSTGMVSSKVHFTFADNLTGDGQMMALRAGAKLAGLEFACNFKFISPLGKRAHSGSGFIQFQTLGAYIVNAKGERFMERYLPARKERRATKVLLAQGMVKELMEGRGPVYFDMRHFTPEMWARAGRIIPTTVSNLESTGFNYQKDLVRVHPLVIDFGTSGSHGICIDEQGQASLPGLLAGGVAAQFKGCTEFLSGAYISYCSVFGYRAGERASQLAKEWGLQDLAKDQVQQLAQEMLAPINRRNGLRPEEVYHKLVIKLARPEIGIIKNQAKIEEMLAEVRKVAKEDLPRVGAQDVHQLIKANEVRNFVEYLEPIFMCSKERTETRLTHYRLDYPYRDDENWLKWITVKREESGLKLGFMPVPIDTNPIKPKERKRLSPPIQFSSI